MLSICVYCGSSLGQKAIYKESAEKIGRLIAENNITLIYGGGGAGLMGAVAEGALASGGRAIGIIPDWLQSKEWSDPELNELLIVDTLSERKVIMAERSDAFIALPGGLGTLDELTEMLTWNQLSVMNKPIGLLNIDGYFDKLIEFLNYCADQNFIARMELDRIIIEEDEEMLLRRIMEAAGK
jgi:uncharacterized protein (TIGR00730 family)